MNAGSAMCAARLVIIEGADGVGTTTQASMLFKYMLREHSWTKPVLTSEPSSTPVGHMIRNLLRTATSLPAVATAALFYADRKAHFQDIIIPALEQGHWVVCDRNWQSSLVYQGLISSQEDINIVRKLNQQFATFESSLCYVLDVPAEEAKRRRTGRAVQEAYETDAIQELVLAAYKQVPQYDPRAWLLPCGGQSIQEVHSKIVAQLRPYLINN